jgi:hypothetical protein
LHGFHVFSAVVAVDDAFGRRARVIKEYGAGEGLSQTMARFVDYVAAMAAERAA